ncbi:MAG: hypothetical protein WCK98_06055 [bacterium]
MIIDKLKNKILEKVNHQKPYSKWRFWLIEGGWIAAILGLLTLVCFGLAFAIWDWIEAANIPDPQGFNPFMLIFKGLPELVLIAAVLSVIIYYLYRQTDFPLVKNRLLLSLILILFVTVTTSIILITVENNDNAQKGFESAQNGLDNSIYRPKRIQQFYNESKEKGIINGRIDRIEPRFEDVGFTLVNPEEKIDFVTSRQIFKDFKVGDTVTIRFDPKDKNKVLEIKPFQPPRGSIRGPGANLQNSSPRLPPPGISGY